MRSRRIGITRATGELVVWFVLAVTAFGFSFSFSRAATTYAWGAAAWPRGVILLIVAGAVAQYVFATPPHAVVRAHKAGATDARRSRRYVLASLALPLVYVALLPYTGFYVTTPLFLAGYLAVLGERRLPVLIIVPIVTYAIIVTLFSAVFYVALPTGNWPGFYDLSNALLAWLR